MYHFLERLNKMSSSDINDLLNILVIKSLVSTYFNDPVKSSSPEIKRAVTNRSEL